jgi:hypothetical protein
VHAGQLFFWLCCPAFSCCAGHQDAQPAKPSRDLQRTWRDIQSVSHQPWRASFAREQVIAPPSRNGGPRLLMAHDRAEGDEIQMTQEMLGFTLWVYRPSVSVVASTSRERGMIWAGDTSRCLTVPEGRDGLQLLRRRMLWVQRKIFSPASAGLKRSQARWDHRI